MSTTPPRPRRRTYFTLRQVGAAPDAGAGVGAGDGEGEGTVGAVGVVSTGAVGTGKLLRGWAAPQRGGPCRKGAEEVDVLVTLGVVRLPRHVAAAVIQVGVHLAAPVQSKD